MGAAGSRILDGWALLPTWSPLTTIGYEIKVSRSDWLQDQKYEDYRTGCHLFYVVAPKGIVQKAELPNGVGLIEPIGKGDGERLVMRVKGVRQQPDPSVLVHLMAHVLMWRKDDREKGAQTREQRAAFWQKWVEEKQQFHAIGRSVKGRMRTILRDALDDRARADARAKELEGVQAILDELGVKPNFNIWSTRRQIESALNGVAKETIMDLTGTIERLVSLRGRLQTFEHQALT